MKTQRKDVPDMDSPRITMVPIIIVAGEVGLPLDVVTARLGPDVWVDEGSGTRVVTAEVSRQFIADHHAAVQAQRDQRRAAEAASRRRPNLVRDRVRAIARAQDRFNGADLPALAVMTAGDVESRLEKSSKHLDELLTGESHYYRLTGKEAQ